MGLPDQEKGPGFWRFAVSHPVACWPTFGLPEAMAHVELIL